MRMREILNELNIDNRKGWGQTPRNQEVDYFGYKVIMKPSAFLKLAARLDIGQDETNTIANMKKHSEAGGAFGAPTLTIKVPDEWRDGDCNGVAKVDGHEGRHRMNLLIQTKGDIPIETHIFLESPHREWRTRYFTPEIINALNSHLKSQDGVTLNGPFFTV